MYRRISQISGLIVFLFLCSTNSLWAQTIDGPTSLCTGDCANYVVDGGQGGPYQWTSTGLPGFQFGESVIICWPETGTQDLQLLDQSADPANTPVDINIEVQTPPNPILTLPPFPSCPVDSLIDGTTNEIPTLSCHKVCDFSTANYNLTNNPGSNYDWEVIGALDYTVNGSELSVDWGDVGNGFIKVIETNAIGCVDSTNLCIEIDPGPVASFTSVPAAVAGSISICRGQSVFFTNTSEGIAGSSWNFGDGQSTTAFSAEHSFTSPGTYEVVLAVENGCNCTATASVEVIVEDDLAPEIRCTGTTCPGEQNTYYADAVCDSFDWQISSNGTVIDGGQASDDYITVEWNSGSSGSIELSVQNCVPVFCDRPATVIIPILSNNAAIEGPTEVCSDGIDFYSLPKYDGTEFTWSIIGNGIIQSGQGSNEIKVMWDPAPWMPDSSRIVVEYYSCFQECGGSDTIEVDLLPKYFIFGDYDVCENNVGNYYNFEIPGGWENVESDWSVTSPDGSTETNVEVANSFLGYQFDSGPGSYTLTATATNSANYCIEEYSLTLDVSDSPPPVLGISGQLEICPGNTYIYYADTDEPSYDVEWQISNDGATEVMIGNPVSVTWQGGEPYQIEAFLRDPYPPNCTSTGIAESITVLAGLTLTGDEVACAETSSFYSATYIEGEQYVWQISPAGAGTIISADQGEQVEIVWHEAADATVLVYVCGQNADINVTVNALPVPVITGPELICVGTTASLTGSPGFASYSWTDINEIEISNTNTAEVPIGQYKLTVVDDNGCSAHALHTVNPFPAPDIWISTPFETGICTNDPPIVIYGMDTDDGLTYQWFEDGLALPGDVGPELVAGNFATYTLEATNSYGCSTLSNPITIFEYCGTCPQCQGGFCTAPTAGCVPAGDISMDILSTNECNFFNMNSSSTNAVAGSLNWNFGDFDNPQNTSTLTNTNHTYPNPGYYTVYLVGEVPSDNLPNENCLMIDVEVISVPLAAKFTYVPACAGAEVEFYDLTSFLSGTSIDNWSWNFDDPSSPDNTSTAINPTHIFSDPGIFDVRLIVTSNTGCQSFYDVEVIVPDPPAGTINPQEACASSATEFSFDSPENIISYQWDFDDPASGAANTASTAIAYHSYETAGFYDVNLTITTSLGCTNTITQSIEIKANNNGLGNISLSQASPICEGEQVNLEAPAGSSYLWSTGQTDQIITVTSSGNYSVTVTDTDGCDFETVPELIQVLPPPFARITAGELDDIGMEVASHYDMLEICEGTQFNLRVPWNSNYSFLWLEDGSTSTSIFFTTWNGNVLSAGNYEFHLTITDNSTGCTYDTPGFPVIVHENPDTPFVLHSSPGGNSCEAELNTFTVDNPQAGITYYWNNGEQGTSIDVTEAGAYYVVAVNSFGCQQQSNVLYVESLPNLNVVPSGCFASCAPDTICMPAMSNIASLQWYFNGAPLPDPAGTTADLIAEDSGSYQLELTNFSGCTVLSDPIDLELSPASGTVNGIVFYDANENGIQDPGELPAENIYLTATPDSITSSNTTTDASGNYQFPNLPEPDYLLVMDTTTIADGWAAVQDSMTISFLTCDEELDLLWPLIPRCNNYEEDITVQACTGTMAEFDGTMLSPGTTTPFTYVASTGCDSTLQVFVQEVTAITNQLDFEACAGTSIDVDGNEIAAGSSTDLTFVSAAGCDSIVTVVVAEVLMSAAPASSISSCADSSTGSIEAGIVSGGTGTIRYSLDAANYQESNLFENLSAGTYTIYVQDSIGCVVDTEVMIEEKEALTILAEDYFLDCQQDVVQLIPSINLPLTDLTFTWPDGSTDAGYIASEEGSYTLSVSDDCGTVSQTFLVTDLRDKDAEPFRVANAFSPNGDGMNDQFFPIPYDPTKIMDLEFHIFDRWGKLLFETSNVSEGWDGIFSGEALPMGVYVWYYNATVSGCEGEESVFSKGNVTLIR